MLKDFIQSLNCRLRNKHSPVLCAAYYILGPNVERHTHTCVSCGKLLKDEREPISEGLLNLITEATGEFWGEMTLNADTPNYVH